MQFASCTNIGKIRTNNEDSLFVPGRDTSLCQSFFIAVADGMGGHSAGEVASMITIKSILSFLERPGVYQLALTNPEKVLSEAVSEANKKVYLLSQQSGVFKGMGSTITAALCFEDRVVIANIGDSRAYHITKDAITKLTIDHTLVQQMLDSGQLSNENAVNNPQRHILTRAIGIRSEETPDIFQYKWEKGDMLLLASDGLFEQTTEQDIYQALQEESTIQQKCDALVALAMEKGGTDNISVCIAFNCEEVESE